MGTLCAHIFDFLLFVYLNFNNHYPFEGTPSSHSSMQLRPVSSA